MWKLAIDATLEAEYKKKLLPGLIKRVKAWEKGTGKTAIYRWFRAELLPDWNEEHPKRTEVLEKLLTAKPTEAYNLNKQLMEKLVIGYDESKLTGKMPPKSYRRRFRLIESIFDYEGQLSASKSKSYWLAERIGHNTCTYCNRQYTFTVSGRNDSERITRPAFDHWFPKSLFPLLSLNLYNLIPSCTICNSGAKGDKIFKLGEYVHPYEQIVDEPQFKFVPEVASEGGWHVILERDAAAHPEVDRTINAFALDRIYGMHGNLEVKDMMDFAQAYNGTYLKSIYEKVSKDLGASGFSQEEIYRMLFGTEVDPAKNLDRPLSKLKRDLLEYLHIIEKR